MVGRSMQDPVRPRQIGEDDYYAEQLCRSRIRAFVMMLLFLDDGLRMPKIPRLFECRPQRRGTSVASAAAEIMWSAKVHL